MGSTHVDDRFFSFCFIMLSSCCIALSNLIGSTQLLINDHASMINDRGDKSVGNSVEDSLLVKIGCCFFFLVSIVQRIEQREPWRE